MVDAQRIAHGLEQPADGVGTDVDAKVAEHHGDFRGRAAGPFQAGDGVAGRVVFEQAFDHGDEVAIFFREWPSTAHTAHASRRHVVIQELLSAPRHGMRIHIEERGQNRIATQAEFDRFQAGKQAPLLFVEQAVEQEDARFELIGGDVEGGRVRDQGNRVGRAAARI